MKFIFALVLALLFAAAFAEEATNVVILTNSNFDENVKEGSWLVELCVVPHIIFLCFLISICSFAPWCGHCKKLAPTWEELATAAKADGKFKVASVDCTVEKGRCSFFC